jgi:transcriptional regulator with XRE-family HTH domain
MTRSRQSPLYARLQELLTDARIDAGLTQQELAGRLARPQSYVSKFESGERRLDVIEFIEVAEALRLEPDAFLVKVMRG